MFGLRLLSSVGLANGRRVITRNKTAARAILAKPIMMDRVHFAPLTFAETFSSDAGTPAMDTGNIKGNVILKEEHVTETADLDTALELMREAVALEQRTGTVSALTIENAVKRMCDAYVRIKEEDESKRAFLVELSKQGVDTEAATRVAKEYAEHPVERREEKLRHALHPVYWGLFNRIAHLVGGVKFLVDLRADVLETIPGEPAPSLRAMNTQLRQLLGHWFSVGLLEIERVTWSSPCAMLQKVSDYEAVHPMRNWTDLKARVGPYRRVFTYTHGSMPGEPLVVLHVALTEDIPKSVSSVVKNHRLIKRFTVDTPAFKPHEAAGREGEDASLCNAAIFYSITSTQKGLQGIELGTHLIKETVQELKEEVPNLTRFSTLSPIPGFRSWLLTKLHMQARAEYGVHGPMFTDQELSDLAAVFKSEKSEVLKPLMTAIKANKWAADAKLRALLETPLMRLCARYLYTEKHRSNALDSVANFHLRNGAVMWRINWEGDLSARGMTNSCGIMVNYRYFLNELEANSTAYQEGRNIRAGEQVMQLVAQSKGNAH